LAASVKMTKEKAVAAATARQGASRRSGCMCRPGNGIMSHLTAELER
jgi:hypothetical protein